MAYMPRLITPEYKSKYYTRSADGGYNPCILGNVAKIARIWPGAVIPNCVGYATGRFNEIGGYGKCKWLGNTNAENFYAMAQRQGLQVGSKPKLGACMCWMGGKTLKGADGAGHVVIVEKIINENEVVVSQSGWLASKPFWTATHKKGKDGQWIEGGDYSWMKNGYTFLGFIYNPAVPEYESDALSFGSTGDEVRKLQNNLNMLYNAGLPVTGGFYEMTEKAVKDFQKRVGLPQTGRYDKTTADALTKELTKPEGVVDVKVSYNGEDKILWGKNIAGHWYIQLADFDNKLGMATVTYNALKKMPEIKKK